MKKLLALWMAFLLTFQLVTPVFAEEIEETQAATEAVEVETEAPVTEAPTTEPPVPETAAPEETSAPTEPQPTTETTASTEETTTAETIPAEEPADKVCVRFACTPENLTLVVYPADGDVDQAIEAEEDGSYLLTAGEYAYLAWAEGYVPTESQFAVADEECQVEVVLDQTDVIEKVETLAYGDVASGKCGDNLTWVLSRYGTLTISGKGKMQDYSSSNDAPWYTYRSQVDEVVLKTGVTTIGAYAFYFCDMTSVTIPDSVRSIGDSAFTCCYQLKKILVSDENINYASVDGVLFNKERTTILTYPNGHGTAYQIPEGVTRIGDDAFYFCSSLVSVTIPESVTSIGRYAFCNCSSLTSVTIPEGVTSIGRSAFCDCSSLTSVTIPDSVTSIGEEAFYDCSSLGNILVDDGNANYASTNGVLFNKERTVLLTYPAEHETVYQIPEGVMSIEDYAFSGCRGLVSLKIPESVTSIGRFAFSGCTSLKDIYYSGSLGALKRMTSDASLPGSCTLHGTTTDLDNGACGEKLVWVLNTDGVLTISGTGEMKAYNSYNSAPWYTSREKMTAVVLEPGVTSIGSYAFEDCSSLTSVTIPEGVTSIGYDAFSGCTALKDIYYGGSQGKLKRMLSSSDIPTDCTLHGATLDNGTCEDGLTWVLSHDGVLTISGSGAMKNYSYSSAVPWYSNRAKILSVVIESGVTSIGDDAFYDCSSLTSITIPDGVTSIGSSAFHDCSSLTSIIIPEGVTSIEAGTFYNCTRLESVTLPEGLLSIADRYNYSAFGNCTSLKSIAIPDSVTSIGSSAFRDCSSLTSITIPEGVTSIGSSAFSGCSSLTSVTILEGVTSIGNYAFCDCSSLTSVTILEGVTSIGNYAFSGCSSLTNLEIPASVTSVGNNAFSDCAALKDIYYGGSRAALKRILSAADISSDCVLHGEIVDSGTCKDSLTWVLDNDGVLTVSGSGKMGYYSTSSRAPWYTYREEITAAVLENGVTSVGGRAFSDCSSLTSVMISESVTGIGSYAFSGCNSLTSVAIPISVISIGGAAFSGCTALKDMYYGGSQGALKRMSADANLPADCTLHGATSDLDNGACGDNLTWVLDADWVLTISGSGTMQNYSTNNHASWYTYQNQISALILKPGVTGIGSYAFSGCSGLTSIIIPNSVTSIGDYAFQGCSGLTSVTIPESVTNIGDNSFSNCTKLASLKIPGSVTRIGNYAFRGCSGLTSVTISDGVTGIGSYAFSGCSGLTSIIIPNSVTSIGDYAFQGCNGLTSVTISESVKSIYYGAFYACYDLADVYYSASNAQWSKINIAGGNSCLTGAFIHYADLTDGGTSGDLTWSLIQDGTLTISGSGAISSDYAPWYPYRRQITALVLKSGITGIGDSVFQNYSGVISVEIPESVTSMGSSAFSGCTALKDIYYGGSQGVLKRMLSNSNIPTDCTLHGVTLDNGTCGDGLTWVLSHDGILTISGSGEMKDYSIERYTTAPWSTYRDKITAVVVEAGVTSIGKCAFFGCSSLTSVIIPASVTKIEGGAFYNCTSMESVTLPEGLLGIEDDYYNSDYYKKEYGAFENCTGLKSIEIPGNVTNIGSRAFYGCSSLASVTIPASVTSIGNSAFSGCSSLTSMTIPGSVTSIGSGAFSGCSSLTSMTIPKSVTSIGDSAFSGCRSLTSVTIPDSVTSIGSYAFSSCSSLTSVTIPESVTSIGDSAFRSCSSLTSVAIPKSVTKIEGGTFYGCAKLESITLPEGLLSIESWYSSSTYYGAFGNCTSLTSVTIPSSVTSIGSEAFCNCQNLTDITFGHRGCDTLSIGSRAFAFSSRPSTPVFTVVRVPNVRTIHTAIKNYSWGNGYRENGDREVGFVGNERIAMTAVTFKTKDDGSSYEVGIPVEFTVTVEPIDTTDDYALTIVPEKTTAQARLSKDGVLTTLSTGTVTVQAQCVQNPAISDEITLTVLPPTGTLTSLTVTTLNDYPGDAELGKPVQMIPVFTPANAADRSVTWSVENGTGTATIDENGLLTPLTVGTVTVYAMTPGGIEGASTVNIVRYAEEITILLNGKEDISRLGAGEGVELSFRLSPEDTTTKDVEWSFINQTGSAKLYTYTYNNGYFKLTGQRAGTVILTATAKDSKQVVATKELTVTDTVRSYALPDGSGNLYYNSETGWITGADETVKNVLIPAQIDGVTIVGIDPYVFASRRSYTVDENTTLTSVSIPNTVVEIGESAFEQCTALSTLRFAPGSKLTTIGKRAFSQCSSITSLTIPDSARNIGDGAFGGLENLKYLTMSGEVDGSAWLGDYWHTLDTLTLTGTYVLGGTTGENDDYSWTSVPAGRNARKVILSEGITKIGDYAFSGCQGIEQVVLPSGLQSIGTRAFRDCHGLTKVNIPDGIQSLGEGCFEDCGKLQVLDMSKVPDTFIEKQTRVTGMVTFPTWLVRATNGKAEMDWRLYTYNDDYSWNYLDKDRNHQWYLYARESGKFRIVCMDSYTGIRGSKEIEIKTGIVIRPTDTGYLVSGGKIALSAWNMPSEEKASVDWSLAYGGEDYASIDSSGVLTAKTVHAAQQITVIAQPRDGGEAATKSIWILPKTTGLGLLLDGAPLGSTLSVEQSQTKTLQLSAKVYPDGALQEMQWTSSAENVARVDDTGLVTLVQPGTAVIKAATKDGSKLTAQVTLYVTYVDSAGKLTLTAAAMPEIGLQPGQSVRLTLRGEEKIPAENVIFSVPVSQSAMGSIDENGRFIAGNTPGKVTVTAALKGDPLGRAASITIPVIPAQAAKLSLTAALPEGPGQLVNGMAIFDQADMKRDVFFSVNAQAYDRLGQSMEADLLWSSTDSSIAEVDGEGNVTVKAGASGQCAIVATAQDFAQATGSILISVRDYSPRLGTATMKLNTALTQGAVVDLVESYGNAIRSVTVNDNRFSVDYEDNLLTLRAGEGVTKGTYPMTLSVLCDNDQTYPYFITVKATQTLPKLGVKQTEKFNLFYRNSEASLVITGGEVESAELIGTDDFVLENEDGVPVIRYADPENVPEKPDTKATISVRFAGYSVPVTKALTIATVNTAPKLTLNPTASTLNSAVQGNLTVRTSILGVSDALTFWTDMEGVEAEISGDELAITLTEAKTTTVSLFVLADNWTKPVKLTHKITVTSNPPTLKAASGTLSLNSRFPGETASTGLILSQGNVDLSGVTLTPAAKEGTPARMESDKLNVEYDPISGRITAEIADSGIKNGTYAFNLTGTLTSGTEEIPGGVLKVTVTNALPKAKLSASTVKLNQRLAGQETAAVSVTLTGEDCTLEGFKNLPEGMDFEGGVLTVALPKENSTGGTYSLHAVVSRNGEEVTLPAPLTLKVQTYDKAPAVKLAAKGKLDVLNPNSEIVYTPKLTNCLGTVENVQLIGADCDLFEVEVVDGLIHLTMVEGGEYATRATYKVTPILTACGRDITGSTLSIKVTQSALKLAKLPNRTVYQSQTAPLTVELAATSPASVEIGDVQLNAKTTAALRNALEAAGGIQVDEAAVSFPAAAFTALKPGKYTVILDVTPSNAATDTKPIQAKFTLTVQK